MEYLEKTAKNNAYETLIKTYKSRQNNQDINYDNRLKDKGVTYPSSDYISTKQHKKPTMGDVIKKKGQYMLGGAAGAAAVYAPLAISKSPIKFAKKIGGAALAGATLGLAMSPTKSGMTAKAALSYADKQKYNDFKNKERIFFKENNRAFEKQDRAAAKDPSILDDLSKDKDTNGLLPQFKTKSYKKAYNDYIKSMNAAIDSSLTNFKSASFSDEYLEKVAAYEDAIMEKVANASSSSVKNNDEDEEALDEDISKAMILGGGAIGGGALAIKSQLQNGNLTGRETLYHQTNRSNVESIRKHGVKASFSQDPNNVTHAAAIGKAYAAQGKKLPEYTYFGKKKIRLATPEYQAAINKGDILGAYRELYINRKHMKIKAPTWKMKSVQNPETAGIDPKSRKRGRKFISRAGGITIPLFDNAYNRTFDNLNKKTVTINGDMPPEYVKGSKKYHGVTKQEVVDYIKNNPKRFAKGAVITAAGITAGTAGAAYIAHQLKKKKKARKNEDEQE